MEDVHFVSANNSTESIMLNAVDLERGKQNIQKIKPGAGLETFDPKKRLDSIGELA